jgi:ribosomal protein S27E
LTKTLTIAVRNKLTKYVEIFRKASKDVTYTKVYELNKDNEFNTLTDGFPKETQEWITVKCVKCRAEFKVKGMAKGTINCPQCGTINTIGGK